MIIKCDIDNCLNDLTAKAITLYNARTGKNIQLSDITTYNFSDCLPQDDAKGIIELFKEKELWDSLEPLEDSQWGIQTLFNMGHRVVFTTATHECNFAWKCDWMINHFPIDNANDIIRITDKGLITADIIIDDCLEQITKSCCERICLNYPWNISKEKDYVFDIYRAHNWKEIIKYVTTIERKNKEWEK